MIHPLCGIHAAAITPINSDLSPDLTALSDYLGFLADRGCHGALILGTTGEGPSFSPGESYEIMKSAVYIRQSHPEFILLAGTGSPSLTQSVEMTRAAFDLGYNGVVVLPPYYFQKIDEDGLFRWFSELIRRAVPVKGFVLGYHFPALTGVALSFNLLARLMDAFPHQFIGIKDSSHEQNYAAEIRTALGEEFLIFTGTDAFLQEALEVKAHGCITAPANLISPDLRRIWEAHIMGMDTTDIQKIVTGIRQLLEQYSPFPPTLKALLTRCFGYPRWKVRPPLGELTKKVENDVYRAFNKLWNDK